MFIFPNIFDSTEIIISVQIHFLTLKTIIFQLSKQCLHGTNLHAHHALHISDHHTPYVQQHAEPISDLSEVVHHVADWLKLHVTGSGHRGEAMHAHSIGICAHIKSITRSSL